MVETDRKRKLYQKSWHEIIYKLQPGLHRTEHLFSEEERDKDVRGSHFPGIIETFEDKDVDVLRRPACL